MSKGETIASGENYKIVDMGVSETFGEKMTYRLIFIGIPAAVISVVVAVLIYLFFPKSFMGDLGIYKVFVCQLLYIIAQIVPTVILFAIAVHGIISSKFSFDAFKITLKILIIIGIFLDTGTLYRPLMASRDSISTRQNSDVGVAVRIASDLFSDTVQLRGVNLIYKSYSSNQRSKAAIITAVQEDGTRTELMVSKADALTFDENKLYEVTYYPKSMLVMNCKVVGEYRLLEAETQEDTSIGTESENDIIWTPTMINVDIWTAKANNGDQLLYRPEIEYYEERPMGQRIPDREQIFWYIEKDGKPYKAINASCSTYCSFLSDAEKGEYTITLVTNLYEANWTYTAVSNTIEYTVE